MVKAVEWVISPKTGRKIKVGGPAYEALSAAQKAKITPAKATKTTKSSTKWVMTATRSGVFFHNEKYQWEISSVDDIKAKLLELAGKNWTVNAIVLHEIPQKLWKAKEITKEDMDIWTCGATKVWMKIEPLTESTVIKPYSAPGRTGKLPPKR
jgi:hypothetical protein